MKLKFALFASALLMTLSASAQTLGTWILAPNVTTNYSLIIAPNQVAEVLSLTMDETTSLNVTANNQTIVFGSGTDATEITPLPLVVAGPATLNFGRTTSSSEGSLLTYRVSQVTPQQPATNRQTAAR